MPVGVTSIDGDGKYPVVISPALDSLARDAVRAHGA
jgi:hypothetical protein